MSTIDKTFEDFTTRKDIAILLINQHVSYLFAWTNGRSLTRYGIELITILLRFPQFWRYPVKNILMVVLLKTLLMIDPEKDSVLKRLSRLLGND